MSDEWPHFEADVLADVETSVSESRLPRWWQFWTRLKSWWYWRQWKVADGECGGRFMYIDPKAMEKFKLQDRDE